MIDKEVVAVAERVLTVLVVDDAAVNRRVLCAQLQSEGMEVREAADGVEALALLETTPCDAIISDILMPNMDGYRLCLQVRTNPKLSAVPFLVYSNTFTSSNDEKLAFAVGADQFLRRPARAREISTALRELMSRPARRCAVLNSPETPLMKEYSEQLIAKLEEKNLELETRTAELERRTAELAASQAKVLLQATALANTANAVIITDPKGTILWTNRAFTEMTGYSSDEAIGKTPRLLKSGAHDRFFYESLWRTILAGKNWSGEFVNRRKDGLLCYGFETITPVKAVTGEITHFVGILNDITAKTVATQELESTDRRLKQIIDHTPAVVYGLGFENNALVPHFVSESITRILGFTVEEAMAPDWWENQLHPDDWESAAKSRQRSFDQGASCSEYRLRDKQGKYHWVENHLLLIRDPKSNASEITGFWTDITERKEDEEAIKASNQALQNFLENANDLIQIVGANGRFQFVNRAWRETIGYSLEALEGLTMFDLVDPQNVAECKKKFTRIVAGELVPRFEVIYRAKSGVPVIVEGTADCHIGNEKAVSTRGIFRNVTDRRRLEEQLRQSQKMEAIGQLAGGVAHDFNNIITVINCYSEILMHSRAIPPEDQRMLKQIYIAGERAGNLTRQLLAFSRKQMTRPHVLDLNATVSDVMKMLRRLIGENITLELKLEPALPMIHADAGMMEQVLMNLALNGRDAMPNGGILRIATEFISIPEIQPPRAPGARAGEFVFLSVQDYGTGIAPENLSRLFDPFFTTKDVGKGTGLGLSTVFGIVKQHDGWIEVETELGHGSIFSVFLPVANAPGGPALVLEGEPVSTVGKETILVVEDEAPVRELAVIVLERQGYRVLEAADGDEAIDVWERGGLRIDLLLSDMVMPGSYSGRALAEKLHCAKPSLKVIICSGYSADAGRNKEDIGENFVFLQKPYNPRKLCETVRQCLDAKEPTT